MNSQIFSLPLHILFNYIFVTKCDLGIVGCGLASILTYTFLLICNVVQTNQIKEMDEATQVSIRDKRVWT